jgi:polar amino acid transport system substrate-binding protein
MRTFRMVWGRSRLPESSPGSPRRPSGRRRLLLMTLVGLAVVAVAAVAVACGSSSSSTTTPTSSATTSATPSASSSTVAGVTITADPALHALLPQAILTAGKVRVASDIPYPPWEMFTAPGSNQITGIDYDIAQAIGAKLGIPFVFQVTVFDSIIPALQAGKVDTVFSAMYDNAVRQKVLDFVDYAKDGTALLVKKGNPDHITGLASLAGKTVAVEAGTTQLLLAQKVQAGYKANGSSLTILQYPKDSDAQLAVKAGKAVCDVTDGPGSIYVAKTAGGGNLFDVVQDPTAPNGYDPQTVGAGVVKANTGLRDAMQKALQALISDGTYAKILDKYGQAAVAVSTVTINLH